MAKSEAVREAWVALLLLLLSGCAGRPAEESPMPGVPEMVEDAVGLSGLVAAPTGECLAIPCSDAPQTYQLYIVPLDAVLASLEFVLVGSKEDLPLHWLLRCDAEVVACELPLGEGWSQASVADPLTIRGNNLRLPPGTRVFIELEDNRTVTPDWLVEAYTSDIRTFDLNGRIGLQRIDARLTASWVEVFVETHSGPCLWAGDCTHTPGGPKETIDLGSSALVGLNLTATWQEAFPGQELSFLVSCRNSPAPQACVDQGYLEVTGTSPLHLQADGLFLFGEPLRFTFYDTVTMGYGGTHSDVEVTGAYLALTSSNP